MQFSSQAIEFQRNQRMPFSFFFLSLLLFTAIGASLHDISPHITFLYTIKKARVLLHQEQYEQAAQLLEEVHTIIPKYEPILTDLIYTYFQLGRKEEAYELLPNELSQKSIDKITPFLPKGAYQ